MNRRKNPSSVDIKKVLLDMREYRMGLIQTPDQLRFSYMAVIEGSKLILTSNSVAQVAASCLNFVKCLVCANAVGMTFTLLMSSISSGTLKSIVTSL